MSIRPGPVAGVGVSAQHITGYAVSGEEPDLVDVMMTASWQNLTLIMSLLRSIA